MSHRHRGRRGKAPKRKLLAPTVGLALIVRDEEEMLPGLLASIEGAFDQVVLVDSDSEDRTVEIFRDWCARTGQPHVVDSFEWIDHFAAKRNHAHSLLTTDWTCWADADDTIVGARHLRPPRRHRPPSQRSRSTTTT